MTSVGMRWSEALQKIRSSVNATIWETVVSEKKAKSVLLKKSEPCGVFTCRVPILPLQLHNWLENHSPKSQWKPAACGGGQGGLKPLQSPLLQAWSLQDLSGCLLEVSTFTAYLYLT